MDTSRILMVVTSADRMGSAPDATGFWLEEFAAPYYVFSDARCDITVASPKGGAAPVDPRSYDESSATASTRRFAVDEKAAAMIGDTQALSAVSPAQFDAVFFVGGHGTMTDFPSDSHVQSTVERFYHAAKPVAAVCHGPAAFVRAHKKNGEPLVSGKRFTCFSDAEETAIGLQDHVPFLLETRLKELGGKNIIGEAFASQVVVDGGLITGQNPASSIGAAEAVIHQLRMRAAA